MTATRWHQSLRVRLLLPLVVVSILGAGVTTVLSQYMGRKWAEQQVRQRVASIGRSLEGSTYPLTSNVLESLVLLTGAEFIVTQAQRLDEDADPSVDQPSIEHSTLPIVDQELGDFLAHALEAESQYDESLRLRNEVTWQSRRFFVFRLERRAATRTQYVLLLFDTDAVEQSARRAAWLPLVTGFSVLTLLVGTTLFFVGRLVHRLRRVSDHVRLVAAGDFETALADQGSDEISQVAQSVDSMASQLDALWGQVKKQQSAKLLYQVASGMAHQLRNTLTGAKMALQLHDRTQNASGQPASEEVQVALEQMQIAEDYVERLLVVGQGKQERDEPASLADCISSIKRTTNAIAKHLGLELTYQIEEDVQQQMSSLVIADERSFNSAITNLILNALQASTKVETHFSFCDASAEEFGHVDPPEEVGGRTHIAVEIRDNGPGIEAELADQLFEPFVTTKPEGMGLGLSVVKQVAEHLGGRIEWRRDGAQTVFRFSCPVDLPA